MGEPAYKFTSEDGRKGALARNAKAETIKRERRAKAEVVWRLVDEADDLAPAALAAALELVNKVSAGVALVDVDDALTLQRLATAAETVHRISRLASGQSTSNVLHGQTLTSDEYAARLAELHERTAPPAPTE